MFSHNNFAINTIILLAHHNLSKEYCHHDITLVTKPLFLLRNTRIIFLRIYYANNHNLCIIRNSYNGYSYNGFLLLSPVFEVKHLFENIKVNSYLHESTVLI